MVLTQIGPIWVLLAHSRCTGCLDTRSSAMPLCHLLATHVITCVWPIVVHPRISAPASCQALITLGTSRVDCMVPRGPVSGPVRPRLALTICLLHISPIRPTPLCYLCGLVFLVLQTFHSSHLSYGNPPIAPRIFPVLHSVPPLISITLSIDLRVHCVVHLAQDRFLHRSSGPLKLGKAAKGVAPVPSSETKCCGPTKWCGAA